MGEGSLTLADLRVIRAALNSKSLLSSEEQQVRVKIESIFAHPSKNAETSYLSPAPSPVKSVNLSYQSLPGVYP
jgi:hypothetical protein